jgi:hypothetical protein
MKAYRVTLTAWICEKSCGKNCISGSAKILAGHLLRMVKYPRAVKVIPIRMEPLTWTRRWKRIRVGLRGKRRIHVDPLDPTSSDIY